MNHKVRYSIASQMKEYDTIKQNWIPFIMFMQKPNYRSKVLNTDQFGFRFNYLNKEIENIFEYSSSNKMVIGNSGVFGVGATKDEFTLPSFLSKKTDNNYLNFGGRAYSGFQEILLFNKYVNKIKSLEEILIVSGINDLFIINQSDDFNYDESLMYNKNFFTYVMNKPQKKIFSKIADFFNNKENIHELNKSKKNKIEILKNNLDRNIFFWGMIKKALDIKIKFFLQPCATWCKKKLSNQEEKIFNELDKNHRDNNIQKFFSSQDHEMISDIYRKNCKKYNIDYINLNEHFKEYDDKKNWLFVDRVHLTDVGYEKTAEIILRNF